MRVLVASASKHGSTGEIAAAIAVELLAAGVAVDVYDGASAPGIGGYDAVVVGSAIYMGRWMAEAREFIEQHQEQLRTVPVWLFSSGPVGDDQPTGDQSTDVTVMRELVNARAHHIFAGKLDRSALGLGERLVTKIVHAQEGDFRDWDEIRDWAREIAATLNTPTPLTV